MLNKQVKSTLLVFRRDTVSNRLPRSVSIDSMVDTIWAEPTETVEPISVPEKRLSVRSERALGLVSPSVGRRMKGQRGVNGKLFIVHGYSFFL